MEDWAIWVRNSYFLRTSQSVTKLIYRVAIQYAKAMDLRVVGIDISESQLESAKQLGADLVFNPATNPSYVAELTEKTGGVHAAIVLSASDAAYQTAPDVLR